MCGRLLRDIVAINDATCGCKEWTTERGSLRGLQVQGLQIIHREYSTVLSGPGNRCQLRSQLNFSRASLYLWLTATGAQLSETEHWWAIDLFDVPVTQAVNSVDKWHLNARLDHRLHVSAFKRSGGGQSNFLMSLPVTAVVGYPF